MHHCHMTEFDALYRVPFVRGLQYIHAALLAQGAHCVKPGQAKEDANRIFEEAEAMKAMIETGKYQDYE